MYPKKELNLMSVSETVFLMLHNTAQFSCPVCPTWQTSQSLPSVTGY